MLEDLELEETAETSPTGSPTSVRRMVALWEGERLEIALPSAGTLAVGRSRESDVRIDHPSVSRTHLYIRVRDTISVEDAGSANGSNLRGKPLAPGSAVVLEPGEVVEVGRATLVFQFEGERGSRPPPSAPPAPSRGTGRDAAPCSTIADPAMKRLNDLVMLVARGDINVLLLGETGVGKEVVAYEIHEQSPRVASPIIPVNCAAIPEALFESELFGHERGAFTGATTPKAGLIEAAHGGTLFLDEIGEMPLAAQVKLLRAIERREITRVGATKAMTVDVRFISATHRDLEQAIAAGRFREDLFYRLNGVSLVVPPLRERHASIRLFAQHFLAEACAKLRRPALAIGPDALRVLEQHAWPGNVRELRNVMDRAALLCSNDTLALEHVLLDSPSVDRIETAARFPPASTSALGEEIGALERRRILGALEDCGGNQTLAARRLGISRRRLLNRLDGYAVPRPRKRQ